MRRKTKKFLVLLLMVVLMSGVFGTPVNVFAFASSEETGNEGIQPLYTNLQLLQVSFVIDKDTGEGIVDVVTSFYSNTDYIAILVEFQRKENDEWKHYHNSITRKDDSPATWETCKTLDPGYYYRAVVTVRLYANQSTAETVTLESKAHYY